MKKNPDQSLNFASEQETRFFYSWEVPTDIKRIQEFVKKLESILTQLGWEEEEVYRVSLVFNEWLANAVVHGNLGLEKSECPPNIDWVKWIERHQERAGNQAKKVGVTVRASKTEVTIEIQDEGKNSPEFWKKVKNATSSKNLLKSSGRGFLLSRAYLNGLEFEKTPQGVKVTLSRDLNQPLPEVK